MTVKKRLRIPECPSLPSINADDRRKEQIMKLLIFTALATAVLAPILAITRHSARRERKRIKTWRFGRVE